MTKFFKNMTQYSIQINGWRLAGKFICNIKNHAIYLKFQGRTWVVFYFGLTKKLSQIFQLFLIKCVKLYNSIHPEIDTDLIWAFPGNKLWKFLCCLSVIFLMINQFVFLKNRFTKIYFLHFFIYTSSSLCKY